MDAKKRHAELLREIRAHDYRYYVLDDPQVDDRAYDALLAELRALEAAHPELAAPDSPTQRVAGQPRTDVAHVRHRVRMFSLDNTYSLAELSEFFRRVEGGLPDGADVRFCVEPKLDGASIEVVYEGGALVEASTRGDGEVGEDVTVNVRTFRGVPLTIAHAGRLTLRGEVVIFRSAWEALNEERAREGLPLFANPRNAASGALRMLDPREVSRRPLRALFYQVVEGPELAQAHSATLEWLAAQGLPTHRLHQVVTAGEAARAIGAIDAARATYPFETDGAVVKVDRYDQQDMLGATSKFPRWAVAYKFAAERATTRVRDIVVQVGRTGALTPVAELDPVELSGTTVSRASLHNADQVERLDVRVGDLVSIEKAGEIIPQVVSVDSAARPSGTTPFTMPSLCPACGSPVVSRLRDDDKPELGEEAAQRCENRVCPAQVKARLFHFSRRFAMDVDKVGEALIEQLVDRGIAADVADLYDLDVAALSALDRMGDKSATNVVAALAQSKERTLDRLLCGLGIPQIGQVAAKQLAEVGGTLEAMLAWSPDELRERVAPIHGFGPKMVDAVAAFFADGREREVMDKLVARGVGRPQPVDAPVSDGPLSGRSFCVTGILSRKREDVHADLRARGAVVHDSVKKGTTYLVAGEKTGKTKLDQAKKHGTEVIDEAALERLLAVGIEAEPLAAG